MKTKLAYVGLGTLNLVFVLVVVFALQPLIRGRVSDMLGLGILSVALILAYLAGVRWIERRYPTELLDRAAFREFPAGIALGLTLFTALMLLLWMFGVYHPSGWGSPASIAPGFMFALLAAFLEEIL